MTDMDISRRDFLKTGGVAGFAAVAGCYTQDDSPAMLGPVGGGETATKISEHFVIASSLAAGRDAVSVQPTRIQLFGGAVFWVGEGRFMTDSGLEVDVGRASSYEEAKARVDRFPTLVVTKNGNEYLFQEGDL